MAIGLPTTCCQFTGSHIQAIHANTVPSQNALIMTPEVTIVIPHFNRADLLQFTLQSLQEQTLQNWEAIVVDDGSSDDQWNQIQKFKDERIQFWQRTDGIKGPSRCRNIGLQKASGRYVIFVDSDDFVAQWALKKRVNWMDDKPNSCFAVFPVMLFHHQPGDINVLWNTLEHADSDLDRFLRSDPPWHTSSPIWRRESLLKLNGFNESVMYGDDSDLHTRALLQNLCYDKIVDTEPDVFIRRSENDRITNSLSAQLLDSRLTRLAQGSIHVNNLGSKANQQTWEGQYFMECEFLLFNVNDSSLRIKQVLEMWRQNHLPNGLRQTIVKAYLTVAAMTRNRLRLGLRIARRLAMLLLPQVYFAKPSGFETATLPHEIYEILCERLEPAT